MRKEIEFLMAIGVALVGCGIGSAAPLTPLQALSRLEREDSGVRKSRDMAQPRLLKTVNDSHDNPSIYIFSYDGSQGFMLLPADDNVMPLLGFSEDGVFDPDNIPPALQYWLSGYSEDISDVATHPENAVRKVKRLVEREEIPVMVQANWDQNAPYNKYCPPWEIGGFYDPSKAGCVAVAIAEMTSYWRYPGKGYGFISYNWYRDSVGPILELDADSIYIDWYQILDSYYNVSYTEEQAENVAQLIRICAYLAHSDFGPNNTGAKAEAITPRIVENLGFHNSAKQGFRSHFDEDEWEEMMYQSLKNYGPIVYSGYEGMSGHCFVMDGYRDNGYFHFNWGWGGVYNCYLTLSNLCVGGYSFVNSQRCTYDLRPADPEIVPRGMKLDGTEMDILPVVPSHNVEDSEEETDSKIEIPIYQVDELAEFAIDFELEMTKGLMESDIMVMVYDTDPDTWEASEEILKEVVAEDVKMQLGTLAISHTVSLPREDNDGKVYTVALAYQNKWDEEPVPFSVFRIAAKGMTPTMIVAPSSDDGSAVLYYNLQGVRIDNPRQGHFVIRRAGRTTEKIIL